MRETTLIIEPVWGDLEVEQCLEADVPTIVIRSFEGGLPFDEARLSVSGARQLMAELREFIKEASQ